MFKIAVEKATKFTKPLLTGKVLYKNRKIQNLINTLLVLNSDGYILTCASVADNFLIAEDINEVYIPIIDNIKGMKKRDILKEEEKYGIKDDTVIGIYNIFVDVVNKMGPINVIKHPYLNLAIVKLDNINKEMFKEFPVFNTKKYPIGTSVCNIGFTFPEYDTFLYNKEEEKMTITNKIMNFPLFPLSGIVTRNIIDDMGNLSMFETSMPSLKGQNGGAVFNTNGEVVGMQIGSKRIYNDEMDDFYLDLGYAINSKEITDFLDKNNVSYNKV